MFIYRISQNVNNNYDTFDSAVVVADSEDEARRFELDDSLDAWTTPDNVKVELIGTAVGFHKPTIIIASFNAG